MTRQHLRWSAIVLLLVVALPPGALAHGAPQLTPDQGALAPLAAPVDEWGEPARSGAAVLAATRTGEGMLAFETRLEGPGWIILAVDEPGRRPSGLYGTPVLLDLFEVVGVQVLPSGEVDVSTGTYAYAAEVNSIDLSEGPRDHSEHVGDWDEGFVAWEERPNPAIAASARADGHGGFRVIVSMPEEVARVDPGRATPVFLFVGHGPRMPQTPFVSQIDAEAGSFLMYPARAGESASDAARAVEALRREAEPWPSVAAAAVVAFAVGVGWLSGRSTAVQVRVDSPTRGKVARWEAWAHTRPAGPAARRAVALAALLVAGPAFAPLSSASGEESPADFGPPVRTAGATRDPCGAGAPVRAYNVSAIDVDIVYNRWGDHDPEGMMYVLDENIQAVLEEADRNKNASEFPTGAQPSLITPLTLRARLGECLEIRFTNRLDPRGPSDSTPLVPPFDEEEPHAHPVEPRTSAKIPASALPLEPFVERRASIHVHGLPLDPLAGGAGAVGRNPDSTVPPGESRVYRVSAAYEGVFHFHDHGDPTISGRGAYGFLDDHVRGSNTHGLFGAVVVEPPGAVWTDAYTGEELASGWRADVHVPGRGSFREFVIFYHDPEVRERGGGAIEPPGETHALNYRVETLSHRLFDDKDKCSSDAKDTNYGVSPCEDISLVYSSNVHGDPGTPMPRAYMGDAVKFRIVHAGTEESHVHHLHGHRWQAVDEREEATTIDSQTLSPGETWTQTLEAGAGGESHPIAPGDYIFHCHLFPHLYGGMWAIFRVHDRREGDLRPLPGVSAPPEPMGDYLGFPAAFMGQERGTRPWRAPQEPGLDARTGIHVEGAGAPYGDPCPKDAPERRYYLTVVSVPLRYNDEGDFDPEARVYVFKEDVPHILSGRKDPDPVVLRMRAGECLVVRLDNDLPHDLEAQTRIRGNGKASIHPHLLSFDVQGTDGVAVGWNYDTTIWPSENITYRYYADRELQTIVWHDHANGLEQALAGMYGATIVEPPGSEFRNPLTGGPIYTQGRDHGDGAFDSVYDPETSLYAQTWRADIVGDGFDDFREFFVSIQDFAPLHRPVDDEAYRPQGCPECFDDFGLMAFNYRSEPLFRRAAGDVADLFNSRVHGDPSTNLWEAYAGDPVVVRLHQVAYEEQHTFALDGHRWRFGYKDPLSPITDSFSIGVSEAFNAYLECGAGGCARSPGDYLYRGGSLDDLWAGAWGLFRVHGEPTSVLRPLPDRGPPRAGTVDVCPEGAPHRWFDVHAIEREFLYNAYGDHDPHGLAYVLSHEVDEIERGSKRPEPLVLRVEEGDCVKVKLTNDILPGRVALAHAQPHPTGGWVAPVTGASATVGAALAAQPYTPGERVGMHARLLTHDAQTSYGGRVGLNEDTTVGPGQTRVYTYHADLPPGSVAILEDLGDPLTNRRHGLFGAIVVEPEGSVAVHPQSGMATSNAAIADVTSASGDAWREAVLFMQSGLGVFNEAGQPILVPGHLPRIDAEEAAKLALDELDELAPGGDDRAIVRVVRSGAPGWVVEGALEGRDFRAHIALEGSVRSIVFDGDATPSEKVLRVTDGQGAPVAGLGMVLERRGDDEPATTGADGEARFASRLVPETVSVVRFDSAGVRVPVRAGFDGGFRLEVRTGSDGFDEVARASALALEYVRAHGLSPAPPGVSAVDVTGSVWRVVVEDALRVYRIELDPFTDEVVDFSFEARALGTGMPSYLPQEDVVQAARRFIAKHFGAPGTDPIDARLDRFGAWRVEYHEEGIATSLRVDGQTGRILAFVRAPADDVVRGVPLPDAPVTLRMRVAGGVDPKGELAILSEDGRVAGHEAIRGGGRLVLPAEWVEDARLGEPMLSLPHLGIALPVETHEDGGVVVDVADLRSGANAHPMLAIEQAARYLGGFLPVDEEEDHVRAWAVGGLDLSGDGAWHVLLALEDLRLDVRVDAQTGLVRDATLRPWATPQDDCSGEPLEHLGPHPWPQCPAGWGLDDEEDQGIKGFNYRSEPYVNRLVREPDPALVYSSRAHREPATPIVRAYAGDPLRIFVVGVQDAARQTAFMLEGHVWPMQQGAPAQLRQAQGAMGAYETHRLDVVGGAGGPAGLAGDYLYQGAIQRQQTELGEWGILRVLAERSPTLRALDDPLRIPPVGSPEEEHACDGSPRREITLVVSFRDDGRVRVLALPGAARTVPAGSQTVLAFRLVDESGRPVDAEDLSFSADAPWAAGELRGPDAACAVVRPPSEAAGQRVVFELRGTLSGASLFTSYALDVVPDPQAPEESTSVPGAPLAALLVAAALASVALRRRSWRR